MQRIAAVRDWWRRNGEWTKLSFLTPVALVGLATNVDVWISHLNLLIIGAIVLVALMVAIDRALSMALRGPE